jgi:mediator of RNA polymerase II transcription subunit 31
MSEPAKEVVDEERVRNRKRFELELEFVQALANPFYLHSLAQQGILYQPAFINYLKYLLYWKEKDYARFILCVPLLVPWHAQHFIYVLQLPACSASPGTTSAHRIPFRDHEG